VRQYAGRVDRLLDRGIDLWRLWPVHKESERPDADPIILTVCGKKAE